MNVWHLALFALLFFVVGSAAAACGGGDGEQAALERYFQRFERLSQEAYNQFESLQEELDRAFATVESDEELVEAYRDFFDAGQVASADFIEGINDLEPPATIEDAHREATEAGTDILEALRRARDQLAHVSSQAEMDQILDAIDAEPTFDRFEEACLMLQEIADDNGIAVDLNCDDE